jgi:hypothetical protein
VTGDCQHLEFVLFPRRADGFPGDPVYEVGGERPLASRCGAPASPFVRGRLLAWFCPAHASAPARAGYSPATEADLTVHGVMSS